MKYYYINCYVNVLFLCQDSNPWSPTFQSLDQTNLTTYTSKYDCKPDLKKKGIISFVIYVVLKNKQNNLLLTNFSHFTLTIATYTPKYNCKPD